MVDGTCVQDGPDVRPVAVLHHVSRPVWSHSSPVDPPAAEVLMVPSACVQVTVTWWWTVAEERST